MQCIVWLFIMLLSLTDRDSSFGQKLSISSVHSILNGRVE